VPEAVVYHHSSASSNRFGKTYYYVARNSLLVILKNMPTPLVRRYLLHIVAVPLLYAVYSGMAGQVGGYVHVCLGTLYLLPRMLRKRRMIQCAARRRVEEIHARLT